MWTADESVSARGSADAVGVLRNVDNGGLNTTGDASDELDEAPWRMAESANIASDVLYWAVALRDVEIAISRSATASHVDADAKRTTA